MTKAIEQQLIENISVILKKSLTADATLADLREHKKAGFKAIFTKDAGFECTENTFQPYVEEVADNLLTWQESKNNELLITLVKKIEKLFTVLANFEQSYSN
jgi:primosomal protein N''